MLPGEIGLVSAPFHCIESCAVPLPESTHFHIKPACSALGKWIAPSTWQSLLTSAHESGVTWRPVTACREAAASPVHPVVLASDFSFCRSRQRSPSPSPSLTLPPQSGNMAG